MLDFNRIVRNCANKLKYNFKFDVDKNNIMTLDFKEFKIEIYYSAYEYEVMFNYCSSSKNIDVDLDVALLAAKCPQIEIPKFIFMSNENIMTNYIQTYFNLVDKYFDSLKDTNEIAKIINATI